MIGGGMNQIITMMIRDGGGWCDSRIIRIPIWMRCSRSIIFVDEMHRIIGHSFVLRLSTKSLVLYKNVYVCIYVCI